MTIFHRITLFGSFAAAGVGLAICVGFSATAPADPQEPAPDEVHTDKAGRSPRRPGSLLQPAVRPRDLIAPRPALPAAGGPLLVEPYPALAQQFIPGISKPGLQRVYDRVREQLGSDLSSPPAEPVPPGPAAASQEEPPVGEIEPEAEAEAEPPVAKATIDAEGDGSLSIHIQDADIREVLDLLGEQGNLNILAAGSVQGKVSATLQGVDIPGALDAILKSTGLVARRDGRFIFVGTPADFDSLEQAMDEIGTRVYQPNYVTAAELQTLIQPLLTAAVGVLSVSTKAQQGIETDDTSAGGDDFAGREVVLVRDYEAVLAQIDQVVEQVDVRPLQVAIEAMILSVKLDDTYQFGVNFELLRDKDHVKLGWGVPLDTLAELKFEKGGLKFGFLDSSLGTFLDALETIGDTNVIATPRVLVLNKHRAEIQIGEEKGYVSTTVTETSSTQSVQFLELGAQLRLRPFISSDGLIRMEIHPELSDGSVETESGFTLPNKEVTQVTTNIMVRDGCTVVIGGLMREQLTNTTSQVPLLGNLPLLGAAFRNKQETTERHELLVLITPHIVYEPETCLEGDQMACEFHRRQAVYAEKMSPLGKRSLGRRYFRLAQQAWAAGDRDRALQFAETSVQFDPLNRAAINLRSDIWLGKPPADPAFSSPARWADEHSAGAGPPPEAFVNPMDAETLPGWLLEDLEHEPAAPPAPMHPRDPGQPGSRTDVVRPRRLQ